MISCNILLLCFLCGAVLIVKYTLQAVERGRLYVLYHGFYNDIHELPTHEAGRTPIKPTSTVTLFVTDKHGDLNVVAIQDDYKKGNLNISFIQMMSRSLNVMM